MQLQQTHNTRWNEAFEVYWSALLKLDRRLPPPPLIGGRPTLPSPLVLSNLFTCPNPSCKSKPLDSCGFCRSCRTHLRAGGMVPAVVPDFWKNDAAYVGTPAPAPPPPPALIKPSLPAPVSTPPPTTTTTGSGSAPPPAAAQTDKKEEKKRAQTATKSNHPEPARSTPPPPASAATTPVVTATGTAVPTPPAPPTQTAKEKEEAIMAAVAQKRKAQAEAAAAAAAAAASAAASAPPPVVHPTELTQTERTDSVTKTIRIDNFPALAAKHKQRKFFVASSFHALAHNWFVTLHAPTALLPSQAINLFLVLVLLMLGCREILCYPNGDSVAGAVALFLKVVNIRPHRSLAVTFSFTIVHPTDPSLNWKNSTPRVVCTLSSRSRVN